MCLLGGIILTIYVNGHGWVNAVTYEYYDLLEVEP